MAKKDFLCYTVDPVLLLLLLLLFLKKKRRKKEKLEKHKGIGKSPLMEVAQRIFNNRELTGTRPFT